jgi:hypothetical protein
VAFRNETTTWQYGGGLTVDNLYLTPVTTRTQLGALSFSGAANGSFQNVGGLLAWATSTFPGDLDESFDTVTGVGGGPFLLPGQSNGATDGWDTGIVRENAFAGTWGDAVVVGSASAQGCTTCGFNGTGGGQIVVNDIQPNAGGWWAGLDWPGYAVDTRDLSLIYLTADVRGTVDAGAGQTLGPYQLRIEDDGNDYLAFNATATGAWQSIGGPLSTATLGTISGGDGIFNLYAASYTVTLVFSGNATDWGRGGTLTIDNVYLTGINFSDADSYTVTLTYANEVNTWGTSGTLTIDNLLFTPAPNCDDDSDVDLADFASFQRCFSGSGPVTSGCECADLNGDGHVNLADYDVFVGSLRGPQG